MFNVRGKNESLTLFLCFLTQIKLNTAIQISARWYAIHRIHLIYIIE